jgi:hypothetical protein
MKKAIVLFLLFLVYLNSFSQCPNDNVYNGMAVTMVTCPSSTTTPCTLMGLMDDMHY